MKKSFLQFGIAVLLTAFFLTLSGTVNGQTCPTGMIGYWKMSENSGPTYDDFYGNHDAISPTVSPSQTAGASGRGQLFNMSAGTYLTIPDDAAFDWASTSSYTIELWVKYAGTGGTEVFISRDDRPYSNMSWYIGANSSGRIEWFVQGSNGVNTIITTSTSYNNNQWHHIVAVRDGAANRNYLYVDGVSQWAGGKSFSGFGTLASSNPIVMGALVYQTNPDFFMTGTLDEVAIYSRTLDLATEIVVHYNNIDQYQIGYCDGDDPMFLSEPVTTAQVGQLYTYDVDASGNSKPTYSLIVSPSGMTIDSNTGMISWTPVSMSANGHVVVRATNNKGSVDQDFIIYLASSPDCGSDRIAYWDFNQPPPAGYVDVTGSMWTLQGAAPTSTPGKVGNALSFNGISDSLNLHDDVGGEIFFDFNVPGSFTFELWMKSSASPSNLMVLVGRDEDENSSHYWLGVYPNGNVAFFLRDYPYQAKHGVDPNVLEIQDAGTVDVLDGAWHHIAATYDDNTGTMRLYIDKNMVAEGFQSFLNFGGNEPLNVGMLEIPGSVDKYWYQGIIDEFSIHGAALSQSQVDQSYDNAMAGKSACVYNYAPAILSTPDSVVVQGSLFSYELVSTDINPDDVLSISVISAPAWLDGFSYTPGDSTAVISGTPGNDDVGMHSVTMRVSDQQAYVDQTFQVRVANFNDAPYFTSTPVTSVAQNDTYTYTALATDPDGDNLTYSAPVKPAWLTFDAGTRELSGVPSNDDVGPNNITLRVSDGELTDDQEFVITVSNVNDAPAFTSVPVTQVNQNSEYSYTVAADDPDGDVLIYSAVQKPAWLNFNQVSRVLSGTPGGNDVGFHNVTLRVTDGQEEADQVFQIEVIDVNDAPEFTSTPPVTVDQDANYSYTVLATDADGDGITYSAPQIPSWLSFNPASRVLSGRPTNDDVGFHDVTLRISDGQLETDQAFQVIVNNVNDLPVITSDPVTIAKAGQPYLYQINVSDPDPGDVLTFIAENVPDWLSLTPASTTAILNGTPGMEHVGTHAVIIKVSDGTGDAAQGFSINVQDPTGINDADNLVNRIYPNPASDEVHFEFAEMGDILLKIVDVKGSVMKVVQMKNTDRFTLDISDLSSDIYFYTVTIDEKTSVGKLIKE